MIYPLYHPAKQRTEWNAHFGLYFGEVVGTTAIGRATADLLFKDTGQIISKDLDWWLIEPLRGNQELYHQFNQLQYYRSKNRFTELESELSDPVKSLPVSSEEEPIVNFTTTALKLEMSYNRSTPSDINEGIALSRQALQDFTAYPEYIALLYEYLSYLYEQRAAAYSIAGDKLLAGKSQWLSETYLMLFSGLPYSKGGGRSYFNDFFYQLSLEKSRLRFSSYDPPPKIAKSYHSRLRDFDDVLRINYYKSYMDYLLYLPKLPVKLAEAVYCESSEILSKGGYGVATDIHHMVNIRRRWWILHLILEPDPDLGLLEKDLSLWNRLQHHNEWRELLFSIHKTLPLIPIQYRQDLLHLVTKSHRVRL